MLGDRNQQIIELSNKYKIYPAKPTDFYPQKDTDLLILEMSRSSKPAFFDYQLIDNDEALATIVNEIENHESNYLGIDTETTGLQPYKARIRLIQLVYCEDRPVVIIDLWAITRRDLIQKLLARPNILKFGHNFKFDLMMLIAEGFVIPEPVACTMLGCQILHNGSVKQYSLSEAANSLTGLILDKAERTSSWKNKRLTSTQLQYSANDAGVLPKMLFRLQARLTQENLVQIALIEYRCLLPLTYMELRGIDLNLDRWNEVKTQFEKRIDNLKTKIFTVLPPINLNSSKQLLSVLQDKGFQLKSTNEKELTILAKDSELIQQILKYRSLSAISNTFLNGFLKFVDKDSRLRGNWFQIGTKTGRTSCHQPNLSNIPNIKAIRSCFVAPPGYKLIIADYSQIELRLMAKIANVSRAIDAFRRGIDIHTVTASHILKLPAGAIGNNERKLGKAINFGLIYGVAVNLMYVFFPHLD